MQQCDDSDAFRTAAKQVFSDRRDAHRAAEEFRRIRGGWQLCTDRTLTFRFLIKLAGGREISDNSKFVRDLGESAARKILKLARDCIK